MKDFLIHPPSQLRYSTTQVIAMRALVIVLDSVGIGHAPDAAHYGD